MSLYKFLPSDVDLLHYLKAKVNGEILESNPIKDCHVYEFEPWKLPGLEHVRDNNTEQYYFAHRERSTPNSSRPKRSIKGKIGVWKTNGRNKEILNREKMCIGYKQGLVFVSDKKTPWIMHEYTLHQNNKEIFEELVLCRIIRSGHAKWSEEIEVVNHNRTAVSSNINHKRNRESDMVFMETFYNEEEEVLSLNQILILKNSNLEMTSIKDLEYERVHLSPDMVSILQKNNYTKEDRNGELFFNDLWGPPKYFKPFVNF